MVEQRAARNNREFISSSGEAIALLDEFDRAVSELEGVCAALETELGAARPAAGAFVDEHDRLTGELKRNARQTELVGDFLRDYQLTPAEISALTGGGSSSGHDATVVALGPDFFAALSRVQSIHRNCRHLLRTHHQRAGLELMDHMSGYQEAAYERLCRWVQSEFRNLGNHDSPELSEDLAQGSAVLMTRPVLFNYCLEELAIARHNALFRRFINALTRGSGEAGGRPIEIHAHDPKRYVGDMLAWMHQALANEKELVGQVLRISSRPEPAAESKGDSAGAAEDDYMSSLSSQFSILDKIFESICRPFRVRVDQVLSSQPNASLLLKLSSLLAFMARTMEPIFGAGGAGSDDGGESAASADGNEKPVAALVAIINECAGLARGAFQEKVKGTGERLVQSPPAAPADLSPPQQLVDGLSQLGTLLNSGDNVDSDLGDAGFVMDAFVDPMLEFCRRSSDALVKGKEGDPAAVQNSKVYLLNCYHTIISTIGSYASAAEKVSHVQALVDAAIGELVEGEVANVLSKRHCDVAATMGVMQAYTSSDGAAPLAEDPELSLATLVDCLQKIFTWAATNNLPEILLLKQPRARTIAKVRTEGDGALVTCVRASLRSCVCTGSDACGSQRVRQAMRKSRGYRTTFVSHRAHLFPLPIICLLFYVSAPHRIASRPSAGPHRRGHL